MAADPAPGAVLEAGPGRVRLTFSEAVSPVGAGLTVTAPSGRSASAGAPTAAGATLGVAVDGSERGTYRVAWEVVAQDTHPARGTYTFSVGATGPAPPGLDARGDVGGISRTGLLLVAAARWAHLLGMALAFGVLFHGLVTRARDRRLELLVRAGLGLLVAAEPLALAGQSVGLGLAPVELATGAFGRVLALRLGGALLLWAGLGAMRDAGGRGRAALVGLGLLVALVDGASAHRVAGPPLLAVGLSGLHEAAMAAWAGAIAAAVVTARAGGAGRIAIGSLAVLTVSGLLLAAGHLRSPLDLLHPGYGLVLAVKVALVGAAAGLGLLAARRWEAGAAAGVIALAALLVSLPPPR